MTHASWLIDSVDSLNEMVQNVSGTYAVFQELGMKVNPITLVFIIGVKNPSADSSMHKQRFLRILHSTRTIDFHGRLRLHCACVRSSNAYGVHAIGFTSDSFSKLHTYEMHHVRAIARLQVHSTRESKDIFPQTRNRAYTRVFQEALAGQHPEVPE